MSTSRRELAHIWAKRAARVRVARVRWQQWLDTMALERTRESVWYLLAGTKPIKPFIVEPKQKPPDH
jgi:hypothetical protein